MIFDVNIPVISIVLFAVALVGVLYVCLVYTKMLRLVRGACRESDNASRAQVDDSFLPNASIIVCTRDDGEQLSATLPLILSQRFPKPYEVIVVNDGVPEETDLVVTRLKAEFPNLYLTYVPDSTRNISRKKLAIQLGIKAAKGGVVVVTDASVRVPSDTWLLEMVRDFTDPEVEVVLGYNFINMPEGEFPGRLVTAFDCAADAVAWLSAAVVDKPYRGCGNNIAYRRELYFRNNGFHNSFNLRYGDDDLFVNEITNPNNTVVQLSKNTIGKHGAETDAVKRYDRHRLRHAFTGRTLPKATRRLMSLGDWMLWIVPICSLLGVYFAGVTNIFGWLLTAVLVIALNVIVAINWSRTITDLSGPHMMFSIPFIAAFRPFRNIAVAIASRKSSNPWYTWQ